jgi:hypothetical protein
MFTSLLHHPILLKTHHYIEEHEGERKRRAERRVKDKEMHIRNIEDGDFSIQRISCKSGVPIGTLDMRFVCSDLKFF